MKSKKWLFVHLLGMLLIGRAASAQVGNPTFTDNPSPFPYTHSGVGGSGTALLGGQLVTFQGSAGSGNFFLQEFVNVDPDGTGPDPAQPAIHTVLESSSGTDKSFLQESFVLMGAQRTPATQNNTPSPIVAAPSHTQIAFRQSVKDTNFSSTASLDPGQDIHIHQRVASPTAENGQVGGLSFSNVDILPNKTGPSGQQHATDPSCGITALFCTTIDQQVKMVDQAGATIFSQDADFMTGGTVTLVQGP